MELSACAGEKELVARARNSLEVLNIRRYVIKRGGPHDVFYCVLLWGLLEGLSARNHEREAHGTSKRGLVVPTGFEPVFKYDYDFALILQRLRAFYSSQKGARLKHEVVLGFLGKPSESIRLVQRDVGSQLTIRNHGVNY